MSQKIEIEKDGMHGYDAQCSARTDGERLRDVQRKGATKTIGPAEVLGLTYSR